MIPNMTVFTLLSRETVEVVANVIVIAVEVEIEIGIIDRRKEAAEVEETDPDLATMLMLKA